MKRMSDSNLGDFKILTDLLISIKGLDAADDLAQAFIDIIYEYFQESLVLLRLFSSVPYAALAMQDKQLVNKKANDSGTAHLYNDGTPILTLLWVAGAKDRLEQASQISGVPVYSIGIERIYMLRLCQCYPCNSKKWNLISDYLIHGICNRIIPRKGHADEYSGMLYVKHAGIDKDEQRRMVVPCQEFVAENNVKTVLGFGGGYLITLHSRPYSHSQMKS